MDDEEYLQSLLMVLTNEEPTGIDPDDPYGQADDGIDRYDGFGREVRVEALAVTEGPHGSELVVGFVLAVDPVIAGEVPARGEVRLPFDLEWRRLSGYTDPATYAPEVAAGVMKAAHVHVARHREGRDEAAARSRARALLPSREVQWQLLLDALGRWGRTVEVSPGRLELHCEDVGADSRGGRGVVTVLVTPDAWAEVLATHAGDESELYVDELLAPRDDDEHFVVVFDGDLVRSTREALPPVRGKALARRLAAYRVDPDAGSGWFAARPEGP